MWWLLACAPAEPLARPEPAPVEPDGPVVIDVGTLPDRWVAAEGYTLSTPRAVGDVTGDGVDDAVVRAVPDDFGALDGLLVVAGPLRRPLVLPGDEAAVLPGATWLGAGDLTGDGLNDLHVEARQTWAVPGPLAGVVWPEDGVPVGGELADLDGDGVLDSLTLIDAEAVQVSWGPWTGAPPDADVVLRPPCVADGGPYPVHGLDVTSHPDLDGDGRRDVVLHDSGGRCQGWVFPLPEGGEYDPGADPGARVGVPVLEAIADQTGDGLPDVWWPDEGALLAAPVTFGPDGGPSSSVERRAPRRLQAVEPLPHDLDGDGLTELLVRELVGPAQHEGARTGLVVAVVAGADLELGAWRTAFDVGDAELPASAVAREGEGLVGLVASEGDVVIVDLDL